MNLLPESWRDLNSHELRLLLKERIGGEGQYDTARTGEQTIHIPSARDGCKLSLTYRDNRIAEITAGPALEKGEWLSIVEEIETSLRDGVDVSARAVVFSTFHVRGAWSSTRSGVRILPPPEGAPMSEMEIAEHPFVLEYTYKKVGSSSVSQHRSRVALQRTALLLNVLLIGRTSLPSSGQNLWTVSWEDGSPHFAWSQQSYFASLGEYPATAQVLAAHPTLPSIPDASYYVTIGYDGLGLRIPESLDNSLARFFALESKYADKLGRALYWFDVAERVHSLSSSSAFAALVSAIEALTERGSQHSVVCPNCDQKMTHETPGATKRFVKLVERLAPGGSTKKSRDLIYALRSRVLHGSALMQADELRFVGWDPPEWNELMLHRQLWSLAATVIRGWLAEVTETLNSREHD